MKQRIITFFLLLGFIVAVLAIGGAAVKSGASQALVGGIEFGAIALALVAGIVVRVRTKA